MVRLTDFFATYGLKGMSAQISADEDHPLESFHKTDEVREESVELTANLSGCVNYASWQNSVPVLRSLEICNKTSDLLEDLHLELIASPAFCQQKSWIIQQVHPGERFSLTDRQLQLDPDYLNGLNEAERSLVQLRLMHRGQVLAESNQEIRILARNEWGGMSSMGELLPAFVMPNDPSIANVLKIAGEILEEHGHAPALDGYQSRSPQRAYMLTAAIWSAISSKSLTYANPPSSFEKEGQKVRFPSAVLNDGLATCLDCTLLFASAIEAVGLHPVIIMQNGHCFAGVWLTKKMGGRLIETDCTEVRKAIALKELITFETTLITHRPAAPFETAVSVAAAATQESEEWKFVAAIDVARARHSQIRPLTSPARKIEEQAVTPANCGPIPLPAPPPLSEFPSEPTEEKPTTPAGRIERWQRKLLDLSLRNRLLNFRTTTTSVPIVCPDISRLEDLLACGSKLKFISIPDQLPLFGRDENLYEQSNHQNLRIEFARRALENKEVSSSLTQMELIKRLTSLYRAAKNDLEEGGSNTLFLATGVLKWKPKADDFKSYRAPLLLIPVKITRTSTVSPFRLEHHEDDVRFNATLIQLLKKDFGKNLSVFESDLPQDASGVDVQRVLERMRYEVRDLPGFEVLEETHLATFSFAKYLMWKDLVDRTEQLERNRVVRHLIHNPDKSFPRPESSRGIPVAHEIDHRFTPQQLFHPLPADSSQLAAMMAAAEGEDFVLIGPPGTGKSQTIANIITQCLAMKKTVLFVSEKTAALDVVYRRLRQHGLGDCCLELHSNRAERRKFLDQLNNAWQNNRLPSQCEWVHVNQNLQLRRDQLNAYVAALHEEHPNGWTIFQALGLTVKKSSLPAPKIDWPAGVQHTKESYTDRLERIRRLALTFSEIDPNFQMPRVRVEDWSMKWEQELINTSENLKSAAVSLKEILNEFSQQLGLVDLKSFGIDHLDALQRLGVALTNASNLPAEFVFHKDFKRLAPALEELKELIRQDQIASQSAGAIYDEDELMRIPIEEIDVQWRQACAAFWLVSWFAKRKVIRLLQSYARDGQANPATDVPVIRLRQKARFDVQKNALNECPQFWNGLNTNVEQLQKSLNVAGEIRKAIRILGESLGATETISQRIFRLLQMEDTPARITEIVQKFEDRLHRFLKAATAYSGIAGAPPFDRKSPEVISESVRAAELILNHRKQLQLWTEWCSAKKAACEVGLEPFVHALTSGEVHPSDLVERFELAYARWWLPDAIDRSPPLRRFRRFKHEDAIEDFRKLDDLARGLAAAQARNAVAHQLPAPDSVPRQSELGLLRHQLSLKRPSRTIREMITGMPHAFSKLAPCLLMSPLSIAQYLPTEHPPFDVVIFDEASQITTWDAIGAIARGKQTIIVGDPQQLPPTNFFSRSDDDLQAEEILDHEKDLESILDEARASGVPPLELNWHYRSRHESLIAFSNWTYYENKLVTFPAAESEDRGVRFCHVPHAIYDRGKSKTNRLEAEAIVVDLVARMKQNLSLPESDRLTYGVVTFNSQQQSLIQDLLDQAVRDNPELEWYFSEDRIEPTMVKNLENVQGDERDVMFFSITFGKDAAGKFLLNFGALNRDGGHRRMNVAVTRARQELVVYSSFKGEELHAERSGKKGVIDLKRFLEYAEKGPQSLFRQTEGSLGGFESPFEEAVAAALSERGWQIVPQVGVSGFRIDLGVVHPDRPGAYLAGVECDGATYHRSAVACDRDKTRQLILENLGWKIVRVWSLDWFHDPQTAIERLHASLTDFLETDRQSVQELVEPSTEENDN